MEKVFIVEGHWDYEGFDILAVVWDEGLANTIAGELRRERGHDRILVSQHDVLGTRPDWKVPD